MRHVIGASILITTNCYAASDCIDSRDGTLQIPDFAAIQYTLDAPCAAPLKGAAILVASAAAVDRDGFTDGSDITRAVGVPRHDSRYWQREVSRQLAVAGVITLRYDTPGVGCQPLEAIPSSHANSDESAQSPFCVRPEETRRLTRTVLVEALQQAHQTLGRQFGSGIAAQAVLITHGDAAVVAADYLQNVPAQMRQSMGMVAISPILSGARDNSVWRKTLRPMQLLALCKSKPDSCVSTLLTDRIMQAVFSPNELRSIRLLHGLPWEEIKRRVDDWKNWSYSVEGSFYFSLRQGNWMMPLPTGLVLPSRTFSELEAPEQSLAEPLQLLARKRLIFGSDDSNVSVPLQFERWTKAGGAPSELQILPSLGHWLGDSPAWGPVSQHGIDAIRQAVIDLVATAPAAAKH